MATPVRAHARPAIPPSSPCLCCFTYTFESTPAQGRHSARLTQQGEGHETPTAGPRRWPTPPRVFRSSALACTILPGPQVLPSSVAAIRAALARGVTVMLATGKARPAALRAMAAVGLAGPGLLVHRRGPGVFLQVRCRYGAPVHPRERRRRHYGACGSVRRLAGRRC